MHSVSKMPIIDLLPEHQNAIDGANDTSSQNSLISLPITS